VVGNAVPDITEFVEAEAIDLVAMSTHGRTGLDRFLLGSVAEKIIRHVQCPVLTTKAFGTRVTDSDGEADPTPEA
jgi:nucleotide-binding universal stress UspA family protein